MNFADALTALARSQELTILAKATLLLALGLALAGLAGRTRASVRHLIVAATFAALLALPVLVATAPRIAIPIEAPKAAQAFVPAARALPPAPASSDQAAAPAQAAATRLLSPAEIARIVWLAGATIQLLWLGAQLFRLGRLRRTAIPWLERRDAVRELTSEAGVRRPVEVLLHEAIAAPVTCGSAILLPFDARDWSEPDLRRALVHEIEHVRRGDWIVQLAARTAACLYWFHPLVWSAWRRLCLEAERACDDAVLRDSDSAEYADQLVGLARRMSQGHAQAALGMAHRSDLSARVASLLDATRRRGRISFLAASAGFALAVLAVAAIAPITAVAQSSNARPRRATALDRALYEAAESGDIEDIESLLRAGANVNAAIHGDGSPLIGAARSGKLNIVLLLLDRGADPNLAVIGDGNPLIKAAEGGHDAIVNLLLDRNARIDEMVPGDENPLICASANGQLSVVKVLVSRRANVNARVWVETGGAEPKGEWRSPLLMARRGGYKEIVDFLVANGARE